MRREKHAAHAWFGGVDGADDTRVVGDDFAEACWARGEVVGQEFEVVEVVPNVLGKSDAALVCVLEAELQGREKACAAGDAEGHEA